MSDTLGERIREAKKEYPLLRIRWHEASNSYDFIGPGEDRFKPLATMVAALQRTLEPTREPWRSVLDEIRRLKGRIDRIHEHRDDVIVAPLTAKMPATVWRRVVQVVHVEIDDPFEALANLHLTIEAEAATANRSPFPPELAPDPTEFQQRAENAKEVFKSKLSEGKLFEEAKDAALGFYEFSEPCQDVDGKWFVETVMGDERPLLTPAEKQDHSAHLAGLRRWLERRERERRLPVNSGEDSRGPAPTTEAGPIIAAPSERNPVSHTAQSAPGLGMERKMKRRSMVDQLCRVLAGPDAEPLSRIDLATRLGGTDSAVRGVIRGDFNHGGRDLETRLLKEFEKARIDCRDW